MSDVEKFWDALRAKWPHPVPRFNELPVDLQEGVIIGINCILRVLQQTSK